MDTVIQTRKSTQICASRKKITYSVPQGKKKMEAASRAEG